ncbi:hypothetical protein CKO28_20385 [Rhodovibrio sodomensis]|uniref:KfrA N-terminal DNA-binding domain-containing protein n=1 Tax=Rhodovibrio sodomensis TaxID=1088 RepID=A0ABS1DK52_9PROT|nr:DNA-binding protein [Rhodovibrio sodomensis]MBK1670386.1 hypothetical protein [Rhodovibrio sodomensis]
MPDAQRNEGAQIGRPREVSDATILETGRGLVNQGLKVTGSRLRGLIRHGNPYSLKARWDALQEDSPACDAVSEQEMPEALATLHRELRDSVDTQLYAAIQRALREARQEWERKLEAEREDLAAQKQDVHEEWVDTSQYYDELDFEREEAERKAAAAQEDAQETYLKLRELEERLTAETARADAAEKQVSELQAEVVAWCERATRAEAKLGEGAAKQAQKPGRSDRANAGKKQGENGKPTAKANSSTKQRQPKTNKRTNKQTA